MLLTLDHPWPPNLSTTAWMPSNSLSFSTDSCMTSYTSLFTICVFSLTSLHMWRPLSDERSSCSTKLDTGSLSISVLPSTTLC